MKSDILTLNNFLMLPTKNEVPEERTYFWIRDKESDLFFAKYVPIDEQKLTINFMYTFCHREKKQLKPFS